MAFINKYEQTTLGHVNDLKALDKKIYDDNEIKYFRLNEALNNHPLSHKPVNIRSKLAYKELLSNLKPTKFSII